MKTRKEQSKAYYKLLAMKPSVEKEFLTLPGVISVSVGLKVTNGLPTDEMCFRVYVDEKKPASGLSHAALIPVRVNGFDTDVNEMSKKVTTCAEDTTKYRPLVGGSKIFSSEGLDSGTLGCFAIDDETKKVVLLSNYHILMLNGETQGHQIAQPGFCCDLWCCRCGEVAQLEKGAWFEKNVDAAIAALSNGFEKKWTNTILRFGYISCIPVNENKIPIDPKTGRTTNQDGTPYEPLQAGETVFKRGMNSRRKEGLVVDVHAPVSVTTPTKNGNVTHLFLNQILVAPKTGKEPFSRKGDSGAVLLNHLNQVVGLHFADDEVRNAKGKVTHRATESYANPIQDVLKALKITIPDTGTLLSLPLGGAEDTMEPKNRPVLEELTTLVEQHTDGPVLIDAFTTFRKEIWELINHNREVKVAWHRHKGPAFIAHLAEKGKNRAHNIPGEVEGISFQRLLSKMSVVLEKNGSPDLSAAIERYTVKVMGLTGDIFHAMHP